MIRIRKPAAVPPTLAERGPALTRELCDARHKGRKLEFRREVYGAADVKEALAAAQHDKCCFCESKLQHAQYGDVEHFRPKGRARQDDADKGGSGYYWLAYDWTNLYLCCELCNRRHKGDLFPLVDPDQRVRHHRDADRIDRERPLFVDPGRDEVGEHIEFRREYVKARDGSRRGAATITALGLRRERLVTRRRERRQTVVALLELLRVSLVRLAEDEASLEAQLGALREVVFAISNQAEFSAMSRATVGAAFPLDRVAEWDDAERVLEELQRRYRDRGDAGMRRVP